MRRRMRRGRLAGVLGLLLAAVVAAPGCGDRDRIPPVQRVVLVTIDTLRADRVGAYGDATAHTPTLDLLAERGVRFEHAISPAPITLPSHASLMTGLDPPQHGVRSNGVFQLDETIPTVAERMREAGLATAAFVAAFVLEERFGLARGFDVYDDEIGAVRASEAAFAVAERRGDRVVDAALDWLSDAPERFFLWVHLYDPHGDYRPPPRFQSLAGGDAYGGEVAFADHQVGRLLAGVQRRFGMDDLLIVVTSDHGESLGEHGELTHTYGIYDATQRVPLILTGPGLPAGVTVETPVRLVDLAPTLLARAGAPPLGDVRGRDLTPLARGAQQEPRVAYVETLDTQLAMDWSPLLGVRTERYKYIRAPEPELYDVTRDPDELVDLAAAEPERVAQLDARLDALLEGARDVDAFSEISEEDRARLLALGYVVPSSSEGLTNLGVVGGPNPRDFIEEGSLLNRIGTLLGHGQYAEALGLAKRLRSDGERVHRFRGVAAALAGEPELALEEGSILVERQTRPTEGHWIRGVAHLDLGDHEAARREFEAALAISPAHLSSHLYLGRLAEIEGDLEGAAATYRHAAEVAGDPNSAWIHLAELHLRQGRFDEADALFERVGEEVLVSKAGASLRVAETEYAAGREERAMALLRAAAREHPADPRIRLRMASYLEAEGALDEALALRRQLHAEDPDDPRSQNDLAWSLALAGDQLDRALDLATRAALGLDQDPAALDTLAAVRLARGELVEALAVADRALADAPDSVRDHLQYVRAAALAGLGREAEARAALRALGAPAPEAPAAWHARARDLARRLDVAL